MKIKWEEPKAIFRRRWKEKIMKAIRRTAWLRVGVWSLVVLPVCVYFLEENYPSRDFHWYYLPVIIIICSLYMTLLAVIHYYISKSTVSMDDEGIRLGGPDGRIRKYLYDKMTSIDILPNHDGNYSLSWQYENKEIIRGISQEIEISQMKTLIESNSNLELKMREP